MTDIARQQERAPDVVWRDLTGLSAPQILGELTLPLPWLALSLVLYGTAVWPLGLLASFMFFLCGLRLNHEAIHGNLDLPRWGDRVVKHVLSALMLGSNHADAFCHLQHHRDPMGPDDHEGHCGHMGFWQVLAYGPRFPVDLNRVTWRLGGAKWRRRMVVDWLCILVFAVIAVWLGGPWLMHLGAMAVGQCLTALLAVWITHQGTEGTGLAARSQRGALAWMAYLMFYHREHHLFPKVPVRRLPELARRLDRIPAYAAAHRPIVAWLERRSAA